MDLSYVTVLLLLPLLTWSIIWYLNKFSKPKIKSPPGPWGLPILGYLPFLKADLHTQFADLGRKYGPIYKLYLGSKPIIVISSPALVKEVVRDQDSVFGNRDPHIAILAATYGGTDIAWSPLNPDWRAMRKIFVREMLSNSNLEASRILRKDDVRKAIKQCYEDQKPADISQMLALTILNVMTNLLWGGGLDEEGGHRAREEFSIENSKIVKIVGKPNISDFFPFLAWLDIQGIKKQVERHMLSLDKLFNDVIAEHKDKLSRGTVKEGKKDFLQILLEIQENTHGDSKTTISNKLLKPMLMDIVIGGTDTSTTTIEWVMAELMNNPKIMEKAQQELEEVVGLDDIVEEHHIPKLKYLEAIVKETLRLHTVIPLLLPRRPDETSIVGGYTIPKNTRVILNASSIHRDPTLWDNPKEFIPERFLNGKEIFDFSGNNFKYMPFGSGRRMCAGLPLAERMVMYFLASLLHSFNWNLPENEKLDMTEELGIMLQKRDPLIVIPSARLSNSCWYD